MGSSVTRAFGKRSCKRGHGLDLLVAAQHAALELEVVEAVALVRRLGQAHDGLGRQRLLVAQAEPVVTWRPARVGIGRSVLWRSPT